jgi:hypothetical protein
MRNLGIHKVTKIRGRAANRFGAKLANCFKHVSLRSIASSRRIEMTRPPRINARHTRRAGEYGTIGSCPCSKLNGGK